MNEMREYLKFWGESNEEIIGFLKTKFGFWFNQKPNLASEDHYMFVVAKDKPWEERPGYPAYTVAYAFSLKKRKGQLVVVRSGIRTSEKGYVLAQVEEWSNLDALRGDFRPLKHISGVDCPFSPQFGENGDKFWKFVAS